MKKRRKLRPSECAELLDFLLKGGSPAGACQSLNVSTDSYFRTIEEVPRFAAAVQRTYDVLAWNVAAALYQAAMKGNISAQTFWLKSRPPADWPRVDRFDSADPALDPPLSDEQLAQLTQLPFPSLP